MMAAMHRRVLAAFVFCLLATVAAAQVPGLGTYTYDSSGNVTSVGTQTFRYDAFGRVAKATLSPQQEQTYTYDRYGNLQRIDTKLNGIILQAQQPAVNPCTNRIEVPPPGVTGCTNPAGYNVVGTYDAAGNVLSLEGNSFEYNVLNTTTASTVAGVRRVHLYSASGERVATATMAGGSVQRWDYTLRDVSNRVLRRLSQQGGVWRWEEDYIYAGGKLIAAAVRSPEKVLHFHPDHLGTPRLVTGNGGARVTANNYFPFGSQLPSAGTSASATSPFDDALQFTGHERDAATLDYMHARYYAPYLGRFLSADPGLDIEEALHEPQVWNRYAYVTNNPVKFTDADGRYRTFYKEKSLREADVANAPPVIKAAFMIQGGLLLGGPAAEGGLAAVGVLGRAAFTTFPRLFLAMMGIGNAMTGGSSGPSVNLGSGGRPIAGAVNVDNMGPGFQGTMRQIQVAGDAIALPFKNGSVGNVTAQNLPSVLLGQGGQKLAGELARTMQSGSTLRITTQTPGALKNFAELLGKTYKDVVIKDNVLTAVRR